MNDGFFVTDARGVISFANPALAKIHGVQGPDQLEGHSFADFLPPSERDDVMSQLLTSTAEETASSLVTTAIVRPDGSQAIVEIRPSVVVRDGRLAGSRGVVRDVTERVRAQAALLLSDSILRRIGNLVLVLDRDGLVTYASPSLETILGYRPEEALGEGWWQLPWADAEERARVRRARFERSPGVATGERALLDRDGATRWLLFEESDGPDGLLIRVGHDITEHKKLQDQFLQAQKMESVGRLAGGIAHDFNNILTAVLSTTDLLLSDLPDAGSQRTDVLAIREAGERAAVFTRRLLAFSRKQILQPRVVNLNDVVRGMDEMARRLLGEDVEVTTHLASDLGNVRVDAGQMEQVILNLVVNARVGMDQATVARLFEPFFTTKEVGKGTGLGLATVHGIVNQSGGHIWVYSEPSHGATFKIYLPRVPDAADVVSVVREEGATAQATETILLVEDDDSVRRVADRILKRAGYSVRAAASGSEALALIQSLDGPVHLVLSDVVMPGMTTSEFTQRLQELLPGVAVLFMSGYTDEVIVRHGLAQPGVRFLEKPFTVDTLLRRARDALQAPPAG